jgi:hypothetical protein
MTFPAGIVQIVKTAARQAVTIAGFGLIGFGGPGCRLMAGSAL